MLYETVKGSPDNTFTNEVQEMKRILREYYTSSRSQQIIGADWYAHYKFFYQMQHEWIHEQKKFKFWKDKVPKSFIAFLIYAPIIVVVWIYIFVVGGS